MKKIFTYTLLLMVSCLTLQAQKLDHVLGDVMVKMTPQGNVRQLQQRMQTFRGKPTQLAIVRELSKPMRIWLLHFDHATIHEVQFLAELRRQPEVEVAQFNHIFEERETTPDDPNFSAQWQWVNTGQSGGTPDADVDADLAWDLTTGGETADGREIVVCVVEGANRNHPDLQGNMWVNEAEIPNNGLDDDGNGYPDDYEGWDVVNGSDDINPSGHGTTVSGMIGARGNNGSMVSGINWNVKIMHVEYGSTLESNVIAAYTYPFLMRKLYNETNGAEGAFVVATNSSWGIDGGQPSDSPLWCAFYDSLGMVGILSCGSTTNNDDNVDVVGDLPTACPSEFLLSVTATNRNDVRTFSGFGTTHVDLAAPGENVVSLTLNGAPSNSSGTSFASPLVAGIIGLLYAAPCSSLGAEAVADPAATALRVRDAIFAGVDVKPNLLDEVKTGGRANAYNSMLLLLQQCGPCPKPYNLALSQLTDTSANLHWVSTDSTVATAVRWRVVGDTTWNSLENAPNPFQFSGLLACTEYEVQIEDTCADTTSGFTGNFFFKTDGCCEAPDVISVENITQTDAQLTWESVLAATSYTLTVQSSTDTLVLAGLTDTTYFFTGLEACVEYQLSLSIECAGGGDAGDLVGFISSGCGSCFDLEYCPSNSENATEEWIAGVSVGDFSNTSASNDGYGDFTGTQGFDLMTYQQYPVTLTPEFAGNTFPEWFKMWIDFNQDGDFDDPNEEAFDSGSASSNVGSGNIVIPGDAVIGLTRLRVVMQWNAEPSPCTELFNYGEVEDYCVNITEGLAPNCTIASGLDATNIGFTNATLQWSPVADASDYTVRLKRVSNPDWTTIQSAGTSLIAQNLEDCAIYEFQVRCNCIGTESEWSLSKIFSTECYPPCTQIPANLDTADVLQTSVVLSWDGVPNFQNYRLRYKATADANWTEALTSLTTYSLDNLTFCTDYQFTVQATCAGNQESDFAPVFDFKTSCATAAHEIARLDLQLKALPNPFGDQLTLQFSLKKAGEVEASFFDATGRMLHREVAVFQRGGQTWQFSSGQGGFPALPSGVYFVKIKCGDGVESNDVNILVVDLDC